MKKSKLDEIICYPELMINSSCQSGDKEIFAQKNSQNCDSHRITNKDMQA